MASEIVVPRLGWSMEEGIFSAWLKKEGQLVEKGDYLFELEGEKAIQEVETFHGGILSLLPNGPNPGDTVRVGQLLGFLLQEGESPPEEPLTTTPAVSTEEEPRKPVIDTKVGSRPGGRTPAGRIRITPRARTLAGLHDLDWTTLTGTGRDGRIREADVRSALDASPRSGTLHDPSPLSRAFISRWQAHGDGTLPVTLHRRVTADALAARKAREGASYNDLLLLIAGKTLQSHPELNSCWTDAGILVFDQVNIAIAVDTPGGLVAPVIHDLPSLDLASLQQRRAEMVERALTGTLEAADHDNPTFVVTNLGSLGVEEFTPLLNPPLCATLGIGSISKQPVVENDEVIPGLVLSLSLTFDHRIVDGAPAARFLADLCQHILEGG